MSDYIHFLTPVTVIFTTYQTRHHKVKKGLAWMKICIDMPQGVYFTKKCFSFNFHSLYFFQSPSWKCCKFPGIATIIIMVIIWSLLSSDDQPFWTKLLMTTMIQTGKVGVSSDMGIVSYRIELELWLRDGIDLNQNGIEKCISIPSIMFITVLYCIWLLISKLIFQWLKSNQDI